MCERFARIIGIFSKLMNFQTKLFEDMCIKTAHVTSNKTVSL